jgi:uncharacterized repeat protein (TIGR01451 family)
MKRFRIPLSALMFTAMVVSAGFALAEVAPPAQNVPVNPVPVPLVDLGIKKSGGGAVALGGPVNFTLNPFNAGTGPVGPGTVVSDQLPAGVTSISATGPNWNCTVAGQTVSCTYVGPLVGPGQPFPPINIHGTANAIGQFSNCATIQFHGAIDPNAANNTSCAPFVVAGHATIDLGVKKSVASSPVPIGGPVTFTLTPFNNGPGTVGSGGVGAVVTDQVPAGVSPLITASGTNWNCTVAGQNVTCTYVGPPVGPGQLLPKITIQGIAHTPGAWDNCAGIKATGAADTVSGDDKSCAPFGITDAHLPIDLGIKKSVASSPVPIGGPVTFTLTPFNNGPGTVGTGGVGAVLTDQLPAGISPPITASGTNWNCTVAGQNVTCIYVGPPVGPGQLLPKITIQGTAHTPGTWDNCAGIKATGAPDTVSGDDKGCTPVVITDVHLPIDLVAKKTPVGPGGGGFNLNAVNAGAPLPMGTVLQITDYVPLGMTVVGLSAASPWVCTPVIGPPVTGPDVIVCTMTVGAGGIPTGGSLPLIQIKTSGQWECLNCMRVRVLSIPGQTVNEPNLANNVSCAK